jgi:hypothetical protein
MLTPVVHLADRRTPAMLFHARKMTPTCRNLESTGRHGTVWLASVMTVTWQSSSTLIRSLKMRHGRHREYRYVGYCEIKPIEWVDTSEKRFPSYIGHSMMGS